MLLFARIPRSSQKLVVITLALILLGAAETLAQGSGPALADTMRCAASLNTPTRDSVLKRYDAIVIPFDTAQQLAVFYREMIGQGLRQELKLPRPLTVDTYDNPLGVGKKGREHDQYATATLHSVYRFVLHRNGRLTNVRAVGGVRNAAFDDSIVAALVRLDSEQMLPSPPDSTGFDQDTLDVRLTVTPEAEAHSKSPGEGAHAPGSTPLFQLRLPLRQIEKEAEFLPKQRAPKYPVSMRDQKIAGEVLAQFVVRPSGLVDATSIQFLKATHVEFASAVAEVLPSYHFQPMQIAGCNVSTLAQMPFLFGLKYMTDAPFLPNH